MKHLFKKNIYQIIIFYNLNLSLNSLQNRLNLLPWIENVIKGMKYNNIMKIFPKASTFNILISSINPFLIDKKENENS